MENFMHEDMDIQDDPIDPEEEDFAALFEQYDTEHKATPRVGDRIQGNIIAIGMDTVFVNVGSKIDGHVDREELRDDDDHFPYKVGDVLELYVVKANEHEIKLSKAISGDGTIHQIREAFERAIPIEGKVKALCKGGFQVEVFKKRAFCPLKEIDLKYIENPESYVGNSHRFIVIQFEGNGRNIVLSRRRILNAELEKVKETFFNKLSIDSIVKGRVTRTTPFGAFVELCPGIEGLIHISEMSWSQIQNPKELLSEGDLVSVKVLAIENRKPAKINLSLKQVEEDPWKTGILAFQPRSVVQGKVTRLVKFGAFVEIAPGIEGLVHISEMSYIKRVIKPENIVSVGDIVDVMVMDIDLNKRRISLSIREAEGDPWANVLEQFSPGQSVQGSILKKDNHGYVISLSSGISAFMPRSKINLSNQKSDIEKLKIDEKITVTIESIKPEEKRIIAVPSILSDDKEWQNFLTKDKKEKPLGSLADQLKNFRL